MDISKIEERRQSAIGALEDKVRFYQDRHNENFDVLRKTLKKLQEFKGFKNANEKLENTVAELKEELAKRQQDHDHQIQHMKALLFDIQQENKKLRCDNLSSLGRIQVLVRVRPTVAADKDEAHSEITPKPNELHLNGKKFSVDHTFSKHAAASDIFMHLESLVLSAVDGRSIYIIASGEFLID